MKLANFAELLGKTFTEIVGLTRGSDEVVFKCQDGSEYKMYHEQDCCEDVSICDVNGMVTRLIGSPVTLAYEASQRDETGIYESATWTFYHLATVNGYVSIRWIGESNGYYSESVDFVQIKENEHV